MQQALAKNFPYPFHFEVAMIRGVVEHGWATSARGRRNSVWDAQIAFDAGQTMKGSGTITLVTNEALFHEVAAAIRQTGVQRLPRLPRGTGHCCLIGVRRSKKSHMVHNHGLPEHATNWNLA